MLIVVLLEAVRRTLGIVVPIIILVFTGYAMFGQYIPIQVLRHPGISWAQYVNNMYFPAEGIYGITLWIVSTVVFQFVLFGILAQRMGLGQFFVDVATVVAGRYTGGLAKISVVSSAFFGTISGSSIANTVSTGSLTIPNMKRMGYPGHLAGGVEAASSAGGQITPPIMGAAAFVMAEFLEVPYTTIVIAATVPAAMHYIGVLCIVHFQAKRLGLKGLPSDQIPKLLAVVRKGWPTVVPLAVLIYVLFSGYSPHMAAFWGISSALFIGFVNPMHRMSLRDVGEGCITAVKYALAVGAVGAAIGIVVGVVNSTGLGFRLGFMVTNSALTLAENLFSLISWIPLMDITVHEFDAVRVAGDDRDDLHPDGGRAADDCALHHAGHRRPSGPGQPGHSTPRLAPVRALLRRYFGDHATGLHLGLCSGSDCRVQPIQNRCLGVLLRYRQAAGTHGLRLLACDADRSQRLFHLGRVPRNGAHLRAGRHHDGNRRQRILPRPHADTFALLDGAGCDLHGRAGRDQRHVRRGACSSRSDPTGAGLAEKP